MKIQEIIGVSGASNLGPIVEEWIKESFEGGKGSGSRELIKRGQTEDFDMAWNKLGKTSNLSFGYVASIINNDLSKAVVVGLTDNRDINAFIQSLTDSTRSNYERREIARTDNQFNIRCMVAVRGKQS
jgi:hypothetical protein